MAIDATTANFLIQTLGLSNTAAEILQYNDWEVQEGSYNGVYFHILDPIFNAINPAASTVNYLLNPQEPIPVGADIGMWNITDMVSRKLAVYPIPNLDGDLVEDFGSRSTEIRILGLMKGINYPQVMQQCNTYFNDSPIDTTLPQSQQTGKYSGENFRILVHPFFGVIRNVFLQSWRILHTSERFQSVSFELRLIVPNPDYLSNGPNQTPWQIQTQNYLDSAEALLVSILQTFTFITGITTNSYPYSPNPGASILLPLIDTQGVYLSYNEEQIKQQLQDLYNIFLNSVAYLVQNSGGEVNNGYFDSIPIDYSLLPVYTPKNNIFTYSDAQSLITFYNLRIDSFIEFINNLNYDYFLQDNLNSLRNSVVNLNNISKTILTKDRNIKQITTEKMQSLTEIMIENNSNLNNFDAVAEINNGQYFSSCAIPAGTLITLLI